MAKDIGGLRKRAEALLKASDKEVDNLSHKEVCKLVQELNVHQIELELQNEELRRALLEIEKQRDRYTELYDFAPVGYITITQKNIIVQANLTFSTMVGVERSRVIKRPFSTFIHRDSQGEFYLFSKRFFKAQAKQGCELKLMKKDGSPLFVWLECTIRRDGVGNPVHAQAALIDITAQKLAEKEAVNLSKFPPVLRVDRKGNILYKNEAFVHLLQESGLQEQDAYKCILGNFNPAGAKSLKTRKPFNREVTIGEKVYSCTIAPVAEQQYVNMYAEDITERKNAEKALLEKERILSEKNKLLRQKNITLREIMSQLEAEKGVLNAQIQSNVNKLLLPLLAKLKSKGSKVDNTSFDILEDNLKEITTSFGSKISEKTHNLTKKEIEMCNMIKQGLTSKEIANLLNISHRTVETHRNNIRKKLGIGKQEVNLVTYLKSIA